MEKMPSVTFTVTNTKGISQEVIVDGDYDGELLAAQIWFFSTKKRYLATKYWEKGKLVYLHRIVSRPPKGYWVDHINRNVLDNRSCNLRWVTPKENAQNRPASLRYSKLTATERADRNKTYIRDYCKTHKKEKSEYDKKRYLLKKNLVTN